MCKSMFQKSRHIIAIGLAFAVFFVSIPMISFNNPSATSKSEEVLHVDKVPSLEEVYQTLGAASDEASVISKTANTMDYELEIKAGDETIVSEIHAEKKADGSQVLTITEGDITNELSYDKDGTMYLDGKPIIVETETIEGAGRPVVSINQDMYADAMQRMYQTEKVPYGSASDYTKNPRTTYKNIALSGTIKDLSVTAVTGLILIAIGATPAVGLAVSIGLTACISTYRRANPSSRALSIKDIKTTHKMKGLNISSHMSVEKHSLTYYGNENYTGMLSTGAYYNVWEY